MLTFECMELVKLANPAFVHEASNLLVKIAVSRREHSNMHL